MPDENIQINAMYQKLGGQLIDKGIWFSRNAYKLSPKVFTRGEIITFLNQQTGIPVSSLSVADEKIYVENWAKMGQIIDCDLINLQVYKPDIFDCDNYAISYASRGGLIYGLNSFFVAFGNIYDLTGKFIGRHAFNLIIAHENGVLKLYCYEPMNDNSQLVINGQKTILVHGWEYRPDWIIGF